MKARVCQLFEVRQHEFANLSLPCEGRFNLAIWGFRDGTFLRFCYICKSKNKVNLFIHG